MAFFGLVATILGPWWLPLVPIVLLSLRFQAWEAILIGLLMDFIWLPAFHIPYYLLVSVIIVWLLEPMREELLLY